MDPISFLQAIQGMARADLPPEVKLATIDPAYDGWSTYPDVLLPKVTFDGETTMSTKLYPVVGNYIPTPSDRVIMLPVGRTYVVLGPLRNITTVARSDGEYNAAPGQVIPNVADVIVSLGIDNATSPLITKAVDGVGHKFTLNRSGVWAVSTTTRWVSAANGERYTAISLDGSPCASAQSPAGTPATTNVAVTRRITTGQVVRVMVFQSSGGNLTMDHLNTQGWGRLNIAWLGP